MKETISLVVSLFLFACQGTGRQYSGDVIIVTYPDQFDGNKLALHDSSESIRFTAGFLSYLKESHPTLASQVFCAHRYMERHIDQYDAADTSYSYFDLDEDRSRILRVLFADTAGGIEKRPPASFHLAYKVDSIGNPIKQVPESGHLNSDLTDEFNTFKRIVSGLDSTKHYVVIYKKKTCLYP